MTIKVSDLPIITLPFIEGGGGGGPTGYDPAGKKCCLDGACSSSKLGCRDRVLAATKFSWGECASAEEFQFNPSEPNSNIDLRPEDIELLETNKISLAIIVWQHTYSKVFSWKDENLVNEIIKVDYKGIERSGKIVWSDYQIRGRRPSNDRSYAEIYYDAYCGNNRCWRAGEITAYLVLLCNNKKRVFPSITEDIFDWGIFQDMPWCATNGPSCPGYCTSIINTSAIIRDSQNREEFIRGYIGDYNHLSHQEMARFSDVPPWMDCKEYTPDEGGSSSSGSTGYVHIDYDIYGDPPKTYLCQGCNAEEGATYDSDSKVKEGIGIHGNIELKGHQRTCTFYYPNRSCYKKDNTRVNFNINFYYNFPKTMRVHQDGYFKEKIVTFNNIDCQYFKKEDCVESQNQYPAYYVGETHNFWNEPFGYTLDGWQ